ncbi:TIGR02391 family protein [Streptomyces decoyicus]
MNNEWALSQLRDFIETWDAYEVEWKKSGDTANVRRMLLVREPVIERILNIAWPEWRSNMRIPRLKEVHYAPLSEIVRQVEALIIREDELEKNLGSNAPRMRADNLHPLVWDAAKDLWNDGHHTAAVQRAATFLNAHVQDKTGRHDLSDSGLMSQAFSSSVPEVGKPRLRWPGKPENLTVKSMNEGLRNLAPGIFQTIRNPATHGTNQISEQEALEQLATLSLLAGWIYQCDVIRAS